LSPTKPWSDRAVRDSRLPHHTVAKEETFGPVASITVFDTDTDTVAIANGTSYGLTAAIVTSPSRSGRR
jgi:acyl-CoA reductase-like NAD-dependent aldehyde dehydrogenase